MFAVIRAGGKQFKVAQNEVIVVERMLGESGSTIDLGDVLIVGDGTNTTVGKPVVDGAKVKATVVEHTRAKKITVFKRKRRKGYRRTAGHRQLVTVLRISDISAPGMKAAIKAKPAAKKPAASAADAATKQQADAARKVKKADTAPKKPEPKKAAARKSEGKTAKPAAAKAKPKAEAKSAAEKKPKAAPKAKAGTKKDKKDGA